MILKVRRLGSEDEWWIMDNIQRIHISEVLKFEDPEGVDADFRFLDDFFQNCEGLKSSNLGKGDRKYRMLVCSLGKDQHVSVIFDTAAYLCNDSGKTIEKLTV